MRSLSALPLTLLALMTGPHMTGSAAEVPVSPAAAERLLDRAAEVTSELQGLIERTGDSGSENLATLAYTGSPDWRLYYRDRQLMFAIPSRQNLTAAQKKVGEDEAAKLAATMLEQQFQQLLKLKAGASLAEGSVRVVFIEPAAHAIASGALGRSGAGFGAAGYNACCGPAVHGGFAGAPLPFSPAGFRPAAGGDYQGGCGCP